MFVSFTAANFHVAFVRFTTKGALEEALQACRIGRIPYDVIVAVPFHPDINDDGLGGYEEFGRFVRNPYPGKPHTDA